MLIGALEAGGTKMVCALGREDGTIIEQVSIPTTTPEETIPKITAYFKDKGIEALGIGAFGRLVFCVVRTLSAGEALVSR